MFAATLLVAVLVSCSLYGPSDAQIQSAFDAFAGGLGTATTLLSSSSGTSIMTNSSGSVTWTIDASNANSVTESWTFKNYTDSAAGYTINGTVDVTVASYGTSAETSTEAGALAYSGGPVTTLEFHVSAGTSTGGYNYGGYVVANGVKQWTVTGI